MLNWMQQQAQARRSKQRLLTFGALVLIGMALCVGLGGCYAIMESTRETVTFTVLKTERVTYGSGESFSQKYLVFADNETFECTDSLFFGKFNSSDVYGHLQPGKTYRAEVAGWRLHGASAYRNILSATPVYTPGR